MNRLLIILISFGINVMVLVVPGSSADADIVTGLIDHWTFDETSGTTAHDSVGGNDATLHNFDPQLSPWVPGHVGGAIEFSNLTNYVITKAPITQNQYTISFWLELQGIQGINPRVVGPIDGLHHWVVISQEFNRGVGFYYNHGAELAQDPSPPLLNVWEHYAVVFDRQNSFATIYRNGAVVATAPMADVPPVQDWVFGHQGDVNNQGDTLHGGLDDLRIYNRLLTPADVAQLAAVPEPSSLVLAGCGMLALVWLRQCLAHKAG